MNLPTEQRFWHGFAQGSGVVGAAFAMGVFARHCFRAGHWQSGHGTRSKRCYPSPSLRSGPSQAGPILMRGRRVDCAGRTRNCFQIRDVAVESAAITTTTRGSSPCASRLSFSLFFPCRLPAACRTRHRAGLRVPLRARSWPMPPRVTSLPAPSSAGWRVSPPAASSWACRPATRATDVTAFGRVHLTTGTIRADRPGGPFSLRLMGGADV
jgi:hypothetical protein